MMPLWTPHDVVIDECDNIYVADSKNHRVIQFSHGKVSYAKNHSSNFLIGSKNGTVVAGFTPAGGNEASELKSPTALFFTQGNTLFIADAENFRIQKWKIGEKFGSTVAGGNGHGNQANQILTIHGLYVDSQQNIYVSDSDNHRVTLWMNNDVTTGIVVRSFYIYKYIIAKHVCIETRLREATVLEVQPTNYIILMVFI